MPFTLAHPSIVLPFKSRYLNMTLILGSMAPDIIYFVLFSPSSTLGHSFWGSILFNLPICFLLNYLFYKYIQDVFIYTLPNFISSRYMYLSKNKNIIPNKIDTIIFTYSCLIGMGTHVFWDAFTHKEGYFVKNIGLLRDNIILFDMNIPVYKMMQHGSTLIGFLIIGVYIWMNRDRIKRPYYLSINKKKTFMSIVGLALVLAIFFMVVLLKLKGYIALGSIVITTINSLFLSYLIVGKVLYVYIKK